MNQTQYLGTAPTVHRVGWRRLRATGRVASYVLLIIMTVIFLAPLLYLLGSSLKAEGDLNEYPIRLVPRNPQWSNYQEAVLRFDFLKYTRISLLLALTSTILTVTSSAMSGFGFARHYAPLRDIFFMLVLAMLMVPGVVTMIPTFVVFARLRLTNTYWPWVLWGLAGNSFFIFLFRQFFMSIPKELEDAAEVDGCGHFRIFWQIFLPNSGPVIATAAIFNFQGVWSDWFTPKIFLSNAKTTLSVKLETAYLNQKGFAIYSLTFAAVFVFILPMIVVFFLAQRYIIQGIVTTGLKG